MGIGDFMSTYVDVFFSPHILPLVDYIILGAWLSVTQRPFWRIQK